MHQQFGIRLMEKSNCLLVQLANSPQEHDESDMQINVIFIDGYDSSTAWLLARIYILLRLVVSG